MGGSELRSYFSPFVDQSSPVRETLKFAMPLADLQYLVTISRHVQ